MVGLPQIHLSNNYYIYDSFHNNKKNRMTNYFRKLVPAFVFSFLMIMGIKAQNNVVDQVVWVVGDEAILKSDIEKERIGMQMSGARFDGDPYCIIPEQIAVQKLFLNQAKIDSIDIPASSVSREVERWVSSAMEQVGGKDKLEEYFGKSLMEIREERKEMMVQQETAREVQKNLTAQIKLTPSEVRRYYEGLSQDSLPFIPTTVEAQILTMDPQIPITEIDAVKNRLRGFIDRINKGETDFATLALLYSEDNESAKRGGEMEFMGRAEFVPEFANAAFSLTDSKKVSNVVETEYGYHIIQLVERRGDKAKFRHILLKAKVPAEELQKTTAKLDSILIDINAKKFTFDEAATFLSSDKATRNNNGLMVNNNMMNRNSDNYGTSKFTMEELPQEAAKAISGLKTGEISKAFVMKNPSGKDVVAIVKLKSRVDGHKANISDDFQALKAIVEQRKKNKVISEWIAKKIKETYVRIDDDWKNCDFNYSGWVR